MFSLCVLRSSLLFAFPILSTCILNGALNKDNTLPSKCYYMFLFSFSLARYLYVTVRKQTCLMRINIHISFRFFVSHSHHITFILICKKKAAGLKCARITIYFYILINTYKNESTKMSSTLVMRSSFKCMCLLVILLAAI